MAKQPRKRVVTSNDAQTQSGAYELPDPVGTDEFTTLCVVPKSFRLTLTNHVEVHYQVGVRLMPTDHAENWFAKAMGVVPAPQGFVECDAIPFSEDEQFSAADLESRRAQAEEAAAAGGSTTDPANAQQTGENAPA